MVKEVEGMQTIDYSKISITAKLVAYLRQFSDIAFAQDVASYIHAGEALQEIASKVETPAGKEKQAEEEGKVTAPLLEARYKSIVELIRKTGIKQVFELASGFSLRGLAMSQNADICYVETDLSDLNQEKTKLIADLRERHKLSDFGNHFIRTANALDRSDLEAAAALLKHDQPVVIVAEGLIPYLSVAEQATLADNVRFLLSKFNGGAWITPDFATKQMAEDISDHRKRFRTAINSATDRQLHEAAFDSEEALDEFIREHGFTGESWYQTDLVTKLVSPERLGLSSAVVDCLKPHMRIWLLSPTNPS